MPDLKTVTLADAIIKQLDDPMYKTWPIPAAVRDAVRRALNATLAEHGTGKEEGKPRAPVENVTELELHSTEANSTGADAAPAAQSAGQLAFAWATHHDEPMLFLDREEAALYCEDDEQPIPLYAAPVNGAEQSVGQEAVVLTDDLVSSTLKEYQLALQTDPRNTDQMRNSPTWPRVVDSMQKGAMREALTFALGRSAVPVNGGERDAALEKAWNFVDAVRLLITPGAFDLRDSPVSLIRNLESLLEHVEAARAADAPQANALPAFTDPLVQKVYQMLCNTLPAPQGEHWEGWVARHICAAISAPAKADGDEREAFDALVGKKIAEADVRGIARMSWLSALEYARAALSSPAKVGGDERDEFEAHERRTYGLTRFGRDAHGRYLYQPSEDRWLGWQARAALAAEGE